MSTTPTLEEQISLSGMTYGRRQDIAYRTGLVMQVIGLAVLAVLYPIENPFYTAGLMLFELGVLLSAAYLLVWMRSVKIVIVSSVIGGLVLQVVGNFFADPEYAGTVLIAGIGFICVGAAGMVAKEAYCFRYREGWLLAAVVFPVMVLANLLTRENRVFNSLGFSILFLLLLSLTGKKLRQPLVGNQKSDIR